jgi:hypothetical protein
MKPPSASGAPSRPGGRQISVHTVCLGWHWQPYRYRRTADDVNGRPVLPLPAWLGDTCRFRFGNVAPPHCGLDGGRINITMRVIGAIPTLP